MEIIRDTPEYRITKQGTKFSGEEKPHQVYTGDPRVHVQEIGPDVLSSISDGFNAIQGTEIFQPGNYAAVKVNLGGGIHGVLSSYTDPELVLGLVLKLREMGVKPFICEADMRGHEMHSQLLKHRKYLPMLTEYQIPFVNLSHGPRVDFQCIGVKHPIPMSKILFHPRVKIISFAPPKHHWECGITCAQKNMYGAIAEHRKSIYHRKFHLIDYVVAAAARIMRPALSIVGTKQLGAGLGPHFCIPVNFYRLIFARDMLACDKFCAEVLGYPEHLIKYHQINRQGQQIQYELSSTSTPIPPATLRKIHKNYISPEYVKNWKMALWTQYFVPSIFQFQAYQYFESLLTWMNHKFYAKLGDQPMVMP